MKIKVIMKNLLDILMFTIALILSLMPLNASWIDIGDYYELKLSDYPIKQITAPVDKSFILILDSNNTLFKIDYDGNILNSTNLNRNNLTFISLSTDGITLNYLRDTIVKKEDIYETHDISWLCLNLDKSKKFEKYLKTIVASDDTSPKILLNYFTNSGIGIINYNYYHSSGGGVFYSLTWYGDICVYDNNTDTIIKQNLGIQSGETKLIKYSEDNPYIMVVTNYTYITVNIKTREKREKSSSLFAWSDDMKNFPLEPISKSYYDSDPKNDIIGFIPDNFAFAGKNKLLVTSLDQFLVCFNNNDNTYQITDTFSLPYKPLNYALSANEKNLVISKPTAEIDIFSMKNKNVLRTYKLLDSIKSSVITIPKNRNGFFTGNEMGNIKYFNKDSMLTNIDLVEGFKKPNGFSLIISPNPVSDFLQINSEQIGRIEIFTSFGFKVFENEWQEKIDISKFQAGVYFIKIGDKFEKFVKI